jgi:hypothetical protein
MAIGGMGKRSFGQASLITPWPAQRQRILSTDFLNILPTKQLKAVVLHSL